MTTPLEEQDAGLVERLRQYEGRQFETTACYNGLRDEAAARLTALAEENAALKHDIERHVQIASDEATRADGWQKTATEYAQTVHDLRQELEQAQEALRKALEIFGDMTRYGHIHDDPESNEYKSYFIPASVFEQFRAALGGSADA